jgi:hypothetical protein
MSQAGDAALSQTLPDVAVGHSVTQLPAHAYRDRLPRDRYRAGADEEPGMIMSPVFRPARTQLNSAVLVASPFLLGGCPPEGLTLTSAPDSFPDAQSNCTAHEQCSDEPQPRGHYFASLTGRSAQRTFRAEVTASLRANRIPETRMLGLLTAPNPPIRYE